MYKYPEIERLKKIWISNTISIKQFPDSKKEDFVFVEMSIRNKSWKLYVDDEYKDFDTNKSLLALFLILFSLEMYDDSCDYLDWCKQNLLDSSDKVWLEYYKSLDKIYTEIKNELGEIDSCISSLDYQLRTGVIDVLIGCKI